MIMKKWLVVLSLIAAIVAPTSALADEDTELDADEASELAKATQNPG
jgi:hypothetical protein